MPSQRRWGLLGGGATCKAGFYTLWVKPLFSTQGSADGISKSRFDVWEIDYKRITKRNTSQCPISRHVHRGVEVQKFAIMVILKDLDSIGWK